MNPAAVDTCMRWLPNFREKENSMAKEAKETAALNPLELLEKLDAQTLDAAMAETQAAIDQLAGKLSQLRTLRKALAWCTGELKRGKGRKGKKVSEGEAEKVADKSPAANVDVVQAIREHLRHAGASTPLEIAQATSISLPAIKDALVHGPFKQQNGRWRTL